MRRPYELAFDETFSSPILAASRWIAAYLPHWSDWHRAAARYAITGGQLQLMIEADQPPWCPALDGALRVSSLQTALVAGPPGSVAGQHQFVPPATVQDGPHDIRHYTPQGGRFEIRTTASADPRLMVAFWMIGLADIPEHSAEICICEIFGKDVTPRSAKVGVGVHPHFDPAVTDDFTQIPVPLDVTDFHDYAAEWDPDQIAFFIDGELVKTVAQSIRYPMQFMLGLYEFPAPGDHGQTADTYPKRVIVDSVRGYRHCP